MINFHKPACSADVVGLDGYCINHNNITSFIVDGNKYLDMGIISGM